MSRLVCLLMLGSAGLWLAPLPSRAADGVPAEELSDALEAELLKGLGDDLLGDPPAKKPAPADAPKADAEKPKEAQKPAALPGEDLGEAGEDDPLVQIGQQMRSAQQLIAQREELREAPELQQEIVENLDKLIDQLRKQQKQQQQANNQQQPPDSQRSKVQQPKQQMAQQPGKPSNQPARDSSERLGQDEARQVDMAEMQDLLKDLWGHLPERTREQMLQSSVEQFLPEYEVMIEKYFRRLAEEQRPVAPNR